MAFSVDPFDDALEDLRISGTVLLHHTYAAPWAVTVPAEAQLRAALGIAPDVRVLPFHLVRRNGFVLRAAGQAPLAVAAPEVAIYPRGGAHTLSFGRGAKAVAMESVLRGAGPRLARPGEPGGTEMLCGVFMVRAAPLNLMLAALPPVLKVSAAATDNPLLARAAEMLALEVDQGGASSYTAARLLEVFCAEAIRAYQRGGGAHTCGWFKGLADERIARALRELHADPARPWSVTDLARAGALSPSRFAARFRQTTGRSVMDYVAGWRANLACRLLRDTALPLTDIAGRVGYDSLPAFSRAFKKQVGDAPAHWRQRSRG